MPQLAPLIYLSLGGQFEADGKGSICPIIPFAIVHVEILTADQSQVLGNISVSCIFELKNFGEFVVSEPV